MTDAHAFTRRTLTSLVVVSTLLWSMGIASILAPLTAKAETFAAGDVIRGTTLTTVYYYATDGQRYAFPNEKTYFTWYENFSGIKTITDSELASIPLAGNIVYRPGSRWIKIQSDPKTYAIAQNGVLHWVESESVAQGLAGDNWNQMIDDVPDVFFVDYSVGASLMDAGDAHDGALVSMSGSKYLVWEGEKHLINDNGANRFQDRSYLDGSGIDLAGLTTGSEITSKVAEYTDAAQLTESGSTPTTSGALSVSVASDTPASQTIPAGAFSVELAKFKFTATSNEDVSIDSMIVHLGGLAATSNFSKMYLYEGETRLTKGKTLNSSTRDATFSALSLSVDAGETRNFSIRADIATSVTSGATANVGFDVSTSISGPSSVTGSFGAFGNTMTLSSTHVGELTITKNSSISNPSIGQEDATIGKFKVEASSTEGAYIHAMTLDISKAADHSNYKILDGSTLVATGVNTSGDSVLFDLDDPFYIKEGNNNIFTVTADIGGQASDNIKVAIEEPADVTAVGDDYGFNLTIDMGDNTGDTGTYNATGGTCSSSSASCSYSTIQGGKLTFTFNGPSASDIGIDMNDVTLAKYTVTAANAVTIEQLKLIVACDSTSASGCDSAADTGDLLYYTSSTTHANLTDIAFRLADGTIFMGPQDLTTTNAGSSSSDDTSQTLTFSDTQALDAGESVDLYVTADVYSSAVSADVYKVTLDMSEVSAEDTNGDSLTAGTDIIPSADLTSNLMTTQSASLAIAVSQPPSSGTYVKGVSSIDTVGFSFTAGRASDVKVTDLTIEGHADDDAEFSSDIDDDIDVGDHVSSCSLYDSYTGTLIDGPESPNSSDKILFENFDWTIEAGEVGKLFVRCNFSNVALETTDAANDIYMFSIPLDSSSNPDVSAEDADGDTITPTASNRNTTPTVAITLTSAGTIAVAADGSMPVSDIILGSSTSVHVASYKITASTEDFEVKSLYFSNCNVSSAPSDGTACSSAGSDAIASAVKLTYTNDAGQTQTLTSYLSSNTVKFDGIEDFTVEAGDSAKIDLWVDTNDASSTGATSGNYLKLNLNCDNDITSNYCKFVGKSSGSTINEDTVNTYVLANAQQIRKTRPTITKASGSPSGAATPGFSEALRLNVSADSRGYVTLNSLLFELSSTDNGSSKWNQCGDGTSTELASATKWSFYKSSDPSNLLDDSTDWTFIKSTGAACTSTEDVDMAYALLDFDDASGSTAAPEIGAGQTITFILEVDTTGASSSSDDSFRVSIPTETTADALSTPRDACTWEDANQNSGADINCNYIKELPVRGGTFVY